MDTHTEPSPVSSDRTVEILKSQPATQSNIYTDYAADFWEILTCRFECLLLALWSLQKSDRYSIYYKETVDLTVENLYQNIASVFHSPCTYSQLPLNLAVCCSVLQYVAACYIFSRVLLPLNLFFVLQCAAVCCGVLHCVAVCCSVVRYVAGRCGVLLCIAVCCSVLRCVAVLCHLL